MFNFWGYYWDCCMEGGRLIHPDFPYVYYCKEYVQQVNNRVNLSLDKSLVDHITYWDGSVYYPKYGGGLIRSINTFGYGTFSSCIKVPRGKGLWPSFWMCGDGPWPDSGEIDILEGYSDHEYFRLTTPYFPWINPSWTTTNNIHYSKNGEHKQVGPRSISIFNHPNPIDEIVNYTCLWTPDMIKIKVDCDEVRKETEVTKYIPQGIEMRVIFNLLCEDPATHEVEADEPMSILNFEYIPL